MALLCLRCSALNDAESIRLRGLRRDEINKVSVAINDPEPLARCLCARLGSPVGIALVVLLTPPLPGPELVLVLQNALHLSEFWSAEGQEKQWEQQEPHLSSRTFPTTTKDKQLGQTVPKIRCGDEGGSG